jgi:hypothetical protein
MLVKAGVNLVSLYGGTEFGLAVRALTTKAGRTPEDWAYLELTDFASPRWVDQGNNTFELQFLVSCSKLRACRELLLLIPSLENG